MEGSDYEFWDRVAKDFQDAVDKSKAELKVNSLVLECIKIERGKHTKPKKDANTTSSS